MAEGRISENEALRYRRLAFYSEDVDRFNEVLTAFNKKSSARCVLLIDKDGHLVAKQGFLQDMDSTALAALVAGSFASTREVAKTLGESQFEVLFHQGQSQSIHIRLVGDRTLQVAVFDNQAKPGMIQVYTKDLAGKVEEILAAIQKRQEEEPEDAGPTLDEGFSTQMKSHLDDLFGDL
jgi:predicted regulator of Ras-like GTPase activity (Roadblock/LC7/MglB family)